MTPISWGSQYEWFFSASMLKPEVMRLSNDYLSMRTGHEEDPTFNGRAGRSIDGQRKCARKGKQLQKKETSSTGNYAGISRRSIGSRGEAA